jgi:hypothetical protein
MEEEAGEQQKGMNAKALQQFNAGNPANSNSGEERLN